MAVKKLEINIMGLDTSTVKALKDLPAQLEAVSKAEEKAATSARKARQAFDPNARTSFAGQSPSPPPQRRNQEKDPDFIGPPAPTNAQKTRAAWADFKARQASDPSYVYQSVMNRTRFTNGGKQGHILGIDQKRLQAAGLGHLIPQIQGTGGGGGSYTSMSKGAGNVINAGIHATNVSGGAGGFEALGAIAGMFPELGALAAAFGVLAMGAQYASKRLSNVAIAGTGYNPMVEGLGMDAGSMGGTAHGMQAAAWMEAGINPIGGRYGDNNYAAKQQKAIQHIRDMKHKGASFDEVRGWAEQAGIPEAASEYWEDDAHAQDRMNRGKPPSDKQLKDDANRAEEIDSTVDKVKKMTAYWAGKAWDFLGPDSGMVPGGPGGGSAATAPPKDPTKATTEDTSQTINPMDGGTSSYNGIRGGLPSKWIGNPGMDTSQANAVRLNLL